MAYRYVRQKIINTPGAFVHEIGGTETHTHLAVSVPPTLLISEFVGQLKGASSHEVNEQLGLHGKKLQWQAGYGVVSFGTGDLDWVKEYIRNQQEHHARGQVYDRLERLRSWMRERRRNPVNGVDKTMCGVYLTRRKRRA